MKSRPDRPGTLTRKRSPFVEIIVDPPRDSRYIRVDGRPLLIVYRANILPDARETARLWREYCKSHDIGDPYLVAAQTFWFTDPREVGFDAAMEFLPHFQRPPDHRYRPTNEDFKPEVQRPYPRLPRDHHQVKAAALRETE